MYKHRDETGEIGEGDGKQEKTNNNIPTPPMPPMPPPPPSLRSDNNRPVVAARQINAVQGEAKKRKKKRKELCVCVCVCTYLGQNR